MIPNFVLWKWKSPNYRTQYSAAHVNTMLSMLRRQGVPMERIVLVTDDPEGVTECRVHPLWADLSSVANPSGKQLPSCYRRLKLFDTETTATMGIAQGERVVSLDIDTVILQDFLKLFERKEGFVGWKVPGVRHRNVFNGSMFMFTAGTMDWMWSGFNPGKSPAAALAAGYMGSDQGYISHQLINAPDVGGWTAAGDGVLSYTRDVLRLRLLPKHARIVFFAGKLKPWDEATLKVSKWILRYTTEPKKEKIAA